MIFPTPLPIPTPTPRPFLPFADTKATIEAQRDAPHAQTDSRANRPRLIGKWLDQAPPIGFGATITLYRRQSGYDMEWQFPDGSNTTSKLAETTISGQTVLKELSSNDYFLVDAQGNLGIYDREGLIRIAKSKN